MKEAVKNSLLQLLQNMELLQHYNTMIFEKLYNKFKKEYKAPKEIAGLIFDEICKTSAPVSFHIDEYNYNFD